MRVARAIDDYVSSDKYEALREKDNEEKWQDISDKDVETYNDILPFLDPVGFRYYIPRYMLWTLNNYTVSDLSISDLTIYAFSECFEEWQILNAEQKVACLEFLKYCSDDNSGSLDSEHAVTNYLRLVD
ncbi:MAG: hypothetical protein GY793_00820 [Proteobacteria bacterium]|nr:hypothetical protein [Pseudomonadota bacterium]